MTIASTDLKLRTPERMTDNADGGGRQTSGTIVDGVLNNVFTDISRLDRVTGRVSLRKSYFQVDTENTDTLLGGHLILIDPPDDDYTFVSMFATGSPTDERTQAKDRVESYVISGPESAFGLYGNHITGQRLIRMFCRAQQASPDQGEVLLLSTEQSGYAADQQYVRVESIDSRVAQTFTDASGDYERDVLVCTIGAPLTFDFYGLDTPPRVSTVKAPTRVRRTQVADAATYFSVQPLTAEALVDALTVVVDSPYVPLVPTSTAESSLVDQTPFPDSASMVASGPADGMELSGTTAGTVAPNYDLTLYFGSGIYPGSLRITRGAVSLKDNGGGAIVALTPGASTEGHGGVVDYENGSFTLTRTTTWAGSVSATATAAGLFVAPPFSRETLITLGNRGYVYVGSCIPLPNPGTVSVSYRALGRWYTLRDGGGGVLSGASSGEGAGLVNFGTGSFDVTLGALPDVGSSILVSWGTPRVAEARYGDVEIDAPVIEHTLGFPCEPASLEMAWLAGGIAKSATANARGLISGDCTGEVDNATGTLWARFSKIPDSNTTITLDYVKETTEVAAPAVTAASLTATGTITASGVIKAGSISLSIPVREVNDGIILAETTDTFRDDGAGGWVDFNGVATTGTINYTTGAFSITTGRTGEQRIPVYTYERIVPYQWIRQTLTGYTTVTCARTPISGTGSARYRLGSVTGTAESEEINGPTLVVDLTPLIRDPVVSGSARITFAGRRYVDRGGSLYYGVGGLSNSGTLGGSLSLASGAATLTVYTGGGGDNEITIDALLTVQGDADLNTLFFRIPAASIKRSSLSIRANRIDTGALITGTADINGVITGTGISGEIDADMGIVRVVFGELVTAAGNESEPWYIADAVVSGEIMQPIAVDPSSIRYNVVTLKSIPIDAEIVGLDPVRLPSDGRVPWVRPGNVAVIHNTAYTADWPAANVVTNLGCVDLTYIRVRDSDGEAILSTWYTLDLDAGTVTWSDPLDLSAYTLPVLIEHRAEDMIQVADTLITGEIILSRALSRTYPVGSYLSTALIPIPQDMQARVSNIFSQTTWSGDWSDVLIGDEPSAAYNDIAYPFIVTNRAACTGRYRIQFTSPTAFTCYLEDVGGIGSGVISSDFSPNNPLTGQPYFTIDADGWGSGWSSGNLLRFNVTGASYPIWLARCTLPGPIDEPADSVKLELRGDAD